MAHTDAHHGTAEHPVPSIPVEGDGISYRGLVWFAVILTVTTIFCAGVVAAQFWWYERRESKREVQRAPLAGPITTPRLDPEGGRVDAGPRGPQPALLVDEPTALQKFRTDEERQLHSYDWLDKNGGIVRLPIDRAKELLLQRGLATRGTTPGTTKTEAKGK